MMPAQDHTQTDLSHLFCCYFCVNFAAPVTDLELGKYAHENGRTAANLAQPDFLFVLKGKNIINYLVDSTVCREEGRF